MTVTPQAGTSPERLVQAVAATADTTGAISFRLGPCPLGYVWQGSVTVTNAPSGALFNSAVATTPWGQWAGPTNFGPVQLWGNETLTVTGVGLQASTQYSMTFFGVAMPESMATPLPPVAPLSTVSVETSTKLVDGSSFAVGASAITIHPPSLTRRLTIEFKPQSGNDFDVGFLQVTGTTTGIVYFAAIPDAHGSTLAIPEVSFTAIEPSVDPSYQVEIINNGTQPILLWIVASTTNPLVLGQESNPIAITEPVTVQGIGPTGSVHNPVWVYRFVNSYNSITPTSGVATTLISAPPSGSVNLLGMMTIGITSGCAAVTLTDNAGSIIWSAMVNAGEGPSHFQLDLLIAGLVKVTIVSGNTVRVTITYDQMPIVDTT